MHEDTKISELQYHPLDAVLDERDIEIDKKAQAMSGQLQVSECLSLKNRIHGLHRFDFDNHATFDEQVEAQVGVQFYAIIKNRNFQLPKNFETPATELVFQTGLIHRF